MIDEGRMSDSTKEAEVKGGKAGIFVDHVDKPLPMVSSRKVPLPKITQLFFGKAERRSSVDSSAHSATILRRTGSSQGEFSQDPFFEKNRKDSPATRAVRREKSAPIAPHTSFDENQKPSPRRSRSNNHVSGVEHPQQPFVRMNPFEVFVPDQSRKPSSKATHTNPIQLNIPTSTDSTYLRTDHSGQERGRTKSPTTTAENNTTHSAQTVLCSNVPPPAPPIPSAHPPSIQTASCGSSWHAQPPMERRYSNRGWHARSASVASGYPPTDSSPTTRVQGWSWTDQEQVDIPSRSSKVEPSELLEQPRDIQKQRVGGKAVKLIVGLFTLVSVAISTALILHTEPWRKKVRQSNTPASGSIEKLAPPSQNGAGDEISEIVPHLNSLDNAFQDLSTSTLLYRPIAVSDDGTTVAVVRSRSRTTSTVAVYRSGEESCEKTNDRLLEDTSWSQIGDNITIQNLSCIEIDQKGNLLVLADSNGNIDFYTRNVNSSSWDLQNRTFDPMQSENSHSGHRIVKLSTHGNYLFEALRPLDQAVPLQYRTIRWNSDTLSWDHSGESFADPNITIDFLDASLWEFSREEGRDPPSFRLSLSFRLAVDDVSLNRSVDSRVQVFQSTSVGSVELLGTLAIGSAKASVSWINEKHLSVADDGSLTRYEIASDQTGDWLNDAGKTLKLGEGWRIAAMANSRVAVEVDKQVQVWDAGEFDDWVLVGSLGDNSVEVFDASLQGNTLAISQTLRGAGDGKTTLHCLPSRT